MKPTLWEPLDQVFVKQTLFIEMIGIEKGQSLTSNEFSTRKHPKWNYLSSFINEYATFVVTPENLSIPFVFANVTLQ